MSWVFLAIAIAGDVAGTAALERASHGRPGRYLTAGVVAYLVAYYAFARALQTIATSVADATFYAMSTTAITTLSVLWLGEKFTSRKAVALILVVGGVVALQVEAGIG